MENIQLDFMAWFKIVTTIVSFFCAYSIFIYNYTEKQRKELQEKINDKVDKEVYKLQLESLNKTIEIFSNKLDKLEDKLDSISFKIRTCKDIE